MLEPRTDIERAVAKYAAGNTFADVGGLWGTVNERVSTAVRAGASAATMIDMQPEGNYLWKAFQERCEELGVRDYSSVVANLDDPRFPGVVGAFDTVNCSGILYHAPSPIYTIGQLRAITRKHLILGSVVVPDKIENIEGVADFTGGQCVFIPGLNKKTKAVLADYFTSIGIKLAHVNDPTKDYKWFLDGAVNYTPWWWLYSRDTLIRFVETNGFKVIDTFSDWQNRVTHLVCERI